MINNKPIYGFHNSKTAWNFMRECDENGIMAGYPDLKNHYVMVLVRNNEERDLANSIFLKFYCTRFVKLIL